MFIASLQIMSLVAGSCLVGHMYDVLHGFACFLIGYALMPIIIPKK